MIWNIEYKHYKEKSYHAIEESFGISWESLIEWKLRKDLWGLLGLKTHCRETFTLMRVSSNDYDTTLCIAWVLILDTVPNMIPQFGPVTQTKCLICLHGTKCSTIAWPWVFRIESCLWLRSRFLGPNPASGCVADFQVRVLVTVPNAFSNSSFINSVCAHAVLERSTDKEWHNPSGNSFDVQGDPLE